MIKSKKFLTLFAILFFQIFFFGYAFADFIVGLDGIKTSRDIIEAQGAGFNSVTVSSDISPANPVNDEVAKAGLSVLSSVSQCAKINLFTTKKQILKKEELRFLSYNAIIDGAKGLLYSQCYLDDNALYEKYSKDWENIADVISEISFVAEILSKGNKTENPFEIKAPLKAASYEYGGIKYTFIVNPTDKRHTIPSQFYQQSYDVVGEKSSVLKKVVRNSKNNFREHKAFVFRYE